MGRRNHLTQYVTSSWGSLFPSPGSTFGLMTTAGNWNALLLFTLTMPCRTFKSFWLMKMCSPLKQVARTDIFMLLCHTSSSRWNLESLFLFFTSGATFPTGFIFLVQKVFLLLLRTLAHIYWSHYSEVLALDMHPHLNTLFSHLTLFCQQHSLLEPEDMKPLQDLINALERHGWNTQISLLLLIYWFQSVISDSSL